MYVNSKCQIIESDSQLIIDFFGYYLGFTNFYSTPSGPLIGPLDPTSSEKSTFSWLHPPKKQNKNKNKQLDLLGVASFN